MMVNGIDVRSEVPADLAHVLSTEALDFVAALHREFNPAREALLARRVERQAEIVAGRTPTFLAETRAIRDGDWRVAPAPHALDDRRVERGRT